MSLKAVLKTIFTGLIPETISKKIIKAYYFRRFRAYLQRNEWESKERDLAIVKRLVHSGDFVVDVGANFGLYTVFLSRLVGNQGAVYSIEPIPFTFEVISSTIKRLSLVNVNLFNYALSNKDGTGLMEVPTYDSGGENFYQARIPASHLGNTSLRHVKVGLKKLDSIFSEHLKKITFIKIDVEGHELPVVEGAMSLIGRSRPAMLIEISGNLDEPQSSAAVLVDHLSGQGYSVYWYDGVKLKPRAPGDKSVNYFFLTQDQFCSVTKGTEGRISG